MNEQTNQPTNYPTNQPTAHPTTHPPYAPPKLTKHGRVAAVTQANGYPPFFQEMIVAETSP